MPSTARSGHTRTDQALDEDPTSMLNEYADPPIGGRRFEPAADRVMLALQYLTALVAVAAAGLLTLIH